MVEKEGKRFPMGICIMCDLCVEACPYNARVSGVECVELKRGAFAEKYATKIFNIIKMIKIYWFIYKSSSPISSS